MKFSSTISTFALAAACLLSTSNVKAAEDKPLLSTPQMIILGGFISGGYLLFQREPVKDFQPRYSVKKVTDIKTIFTKEYLNNLWYFFYDGFIGQAGKTKKTAHGVLGTTAYYLHPLKKASGTVAFGYMIWRMGLDYENYEKHIADLAKHKEDKPKVKVEIPA